ncbi:hypothetical protein BT93_F1224 [Corymbia citriodora subsp. variegata]|nr:hypothetical protein BT93_F1224 [Corymbia citriodora subsp. variegata]
MMVALFVWMAQRFVSSRKPTTYASAASWRTATALLWNRRLVLKSWVVSRDLPDQPLERELPDQQLRALPVLHDLPQRHRPGLNLCSFFTLLVAVVDLRAAFVASCFLGALPPMDFHAVCFTRAISSHEIGVSLRDRISRGDEEEMNGDGESGEDATAVFKLEVLLIFFSQKKREQMWFTGLLFATVELLAIGKR